MKQQDNPNLKDEMQKFVEHNNQTKSGSSSTLAIGDVYPVTPKVCPTCGHCPTCGRQTQPFYPQMFWDNNKYF